MPKTHEERCRDAAIAALTILETNDCMQKTVYSTHGMREMLINKLAHKNAAFFPEAEVQTIDVSVLLQAADYLNQLGGGPMEDRLRLLHTELTAAPPSEKEAQVYKHSIFSDRIERVMGEKEAPATPCTTCGQPMRLGLAVCLNVKCALTGVLMAAAPSSVDLHAEQRRRVHQYEDRIPCGKCGHVHLGTCSICNNCEHIEPPQMHAEQREYEKKFGARPPADGEWPTSQFFAPMIWDYRREGWMARAEQGGGGK